MEDIPHLLENSQKESYMFFIDSSHRNRNMYPHPNHYQVKFSAPYKNVFSLEVLDASVPRTQYSVDYHNNTFCFQKYDINNILSNEFKTIPIGDYSETKFIQTFNSTLSSKNISIANKTAPGDERSKFVFSSVEPFNIIRDLSTIRTVLGFDLHALEETENDNHLEFYNTISNIQDTTQKDQNQNNDKSQTFCAIQRDDELLEMESFTGPLNVGISQTLSDGDALSQTFEISYDANVNTYLYTLTINVVENQDVKFAYIIYDSSNSQIVSGTLTIYSNETFGTITFPTSTILLTADTYRLILYSPKDPSNDSSIDIQFASNTATSEYSSLNLDTGIFNGKITDFISNKSSINDNVLCISVVTTQKLYTLEAPGIYSLIGDRYCIMRCPEIEEHMYTSKAYESNTMGLAKFRLAVMGYGETRMDFSAPAREFHPIGKLDHLTFRFERPDGSLYNFRGINHTITFNIRYLIPLQKTKFETFKLNTNYDPDFNRWNQNNAYNTDESDSSEEESNIFEPSTRLEYIHSHH